MTVLWFLVLTILPGAWIVSLLPVRGVSGWTRMAIGVLLSPLVIALEYVICKSLGWPLESIVQICIWTAVPAIIPMLWRWHGDIRTAIQMPAIISALVLFGLLAVIALSPAILEPKFGVFSRHAFFHSDTCYQLEKDSVWPEEPQLAGVRMAYPWLFHAHWAVIGRACELPPTTLDTLTNLLYLAVLCLCSYDAARLLGTGAVSAWIGVVLLTLGTNFLGRPLHVLKETLTGQSAGFLTGDPRYTPLLIKFSTSNQMPLALALISALVLVVIAAVQRPTRSGMVFSALLLTAVGLMYPPVFPSAFALPALLALVWLVLPRHFERPANRDVAFFVVMLAISAAVVGGFLQLLCADRVRSTMRFAGARDVVRQAVIATVVFGPLVLPAFWAGRGREAAQRRTLLLLALSAAASVALYGLMRLDAYMEYKFVLGAAVFLGPITAAGIDFLLARRPRLAWGMAAGIPIVLAPMVLYRMNVFIPEELKTAPEVERGGYYLQLAEGEPLAGWTRAVRTKTSFETMVLSRTYPAHVPAFTARTMYVAEELEGGVAGYGLAVDDNLLRVRGYQEAEYRERLDALHGILNGRDEQAWRSSLQKVKSHARPFAVVFENDKDQAALALMRNEPDAEEIFADKRFTVLVLSPPKKTGVE